MCMLHKWKHLNTTIFLKSVYGGLSFVASGADRNFQRALLIHTAYGRIE